MRDAHAHLNRALARARAGAEQHIPDLEKVYTRLLTQAGHAAAANFRALAVTAAVDPWNPPNQDLVDGDQLERDATNAVPPIHKRILKAVTPAGDLGIAYDLNHPAPQALLSALSKRLGTLGDAIRQQVNEAVADGYAQGWSVAKTADAIVEKTDMIAPVRAQALARTDLNALSNGSSLALAQQVDGVTAKTWLAADDDKVRETHADADGQTVPIDQPFDVGGEQAQFPGDPDLSDEESFNCRCSVVYGSDLAAASVQGRDLVEARSLGGNEGPVFSRLSSDRHSLDDVAVGGLSDEEGSEQRDRLSGLQGDDLQTVDGVPVVGDHPALISRALVDDSAPDHVVERLDESDVGVHDQDLRLVAERAALVPDPLDRDRAFSVEQTGGVGEPLSPSHASDRSTEWRRTRPSTSPHEGGDMTTTHDEGLLAALRELDPTLERISDEFLLLFHAVAMAARKKHGYRGDGGPCVLCGTAASDDQAHYQALTAGVTEFTLVAAAGPGEPTRWVAPAIAVENQPTEDGRILMPGSVTWRDGVLPLGIMLETPHSDLATAPLCGGIDRFERIGDVIAAAGFFNDHLDPATAPDLVANALQAIDAVTSRTARGISVDLMVIDGDVIDWPVREQMDPAGEEELPPVVGEELDYPTLIDPDGDGDIDALPDDQDDDSRRLMAVLEGVIGGACIVPVPAIANASIAIVAASAGPFELLKVTAPLFADCGCDGGEDVLVSLVAAVAPLAPPKEWFDDPGLDGPTPITVTDDGRLYGHVALWDTCHEGFQGRCVPPPRSQMGYRKFHNGDFKTADGSRLAVGKITLAAGHAGVNGWTEERARAHYDNSATVGAFVRAGNDRHGIWVAGALKSDLSPELVRDLMANPLSGDWRGGELVAAHAVIDPGFPVLRASGFGELFAEADDQPAEVSPLARFRPGRRKAAAA